MSPVLEVLSPGLQTTIQAGPRRGLRHLGVPTCGAADLVSLALANRLVENPPDAPALEVPLTGARFYALNQVRIALAGAPCTLTTYHRDHADRPDHTEAYPPEEAGHGLFCVNEGSFIEIGPALAGYRTYLAVDGGLAGEEAFGSVSTYLPAGFGGLAGRALREGDVLSRIGEGHCPASNRTPAALRAPFTRSWTLRATIGPEADALGADGIAALFGEGWCASRAADRTGVRLNGPALPASGDAAMDSVATLPGTIQLPPGGAPIILGVDGGTTGGYPRAAQIIRADRHLIGQLRPGDPVRLLRWEVADAAKVLRAKEAMLQAWVGEAFRL